MPLPAPTYYTVSLFREFFRPHASPAEETRVGKLASVAVKLGAVLVILLLDPQFSIEFQLIGGVLVLQLLPAVAIGLYTAWPHRWALVSGLAAGLVTGTLLLYQIPQLAPNGRVTP